MDSRIAYKIIEFENNSIKTLFHGINGSRTVETGIWLEAEVKIGRDGSGDRYYTTGWHTLPSLREAEDYKSRFKSRLNLLKIVQCEIKDVWNKEHSPSNVLLSRFIKFGNVI